MSFAGSAIPFALVRRERAQDVSWLARVCAALFGSPNVRRAHGIISTRFDPMALVRRLAPKAFERHRDAPVFATDRVGLPCAEALPRIWLSERRANTRDDRGRVFVELYPSGPDPHGATALELGDRYLGEGLRLQGTSHAREGLECRKAAEILYLHAVRRGNRRAASRLAAIYDRDLCQGEYWTPYIELRARHAKRGIRRTRMPR